MINLDLLTYTIGKNFKYIENLVNNINLNDLISNEISDEVKRIGAIVISENEYFEEDEPHLKITDVKNDFLMSDDSYDGYLKLVNNLALQSKLIKRHYPDLDESQYTLCLSYKFRKLYNEQVKELIDFLQPALGFGSDKVIIIKHRNELVETITGLVRNFPKGMKL